MRSWFQTCNFQMHCSNYMYFHEHFQLLISRLWFRMPKPMLTKVRNSIILAHGSRSIYQAPNYMAVPSLGPYSTHSNISWVHCTDWRLKFKRFKWWQVGVCSEYKLSIYLQCLLPHRRWRSGWRRVWGFDVVVALPWGPRNMSSIQLQ